MLIPITLDLRELPMEATGIVCGVAGRLAQGTSSISEEGGAGSPRMKTGEELEITFLSTARAGTVIVKASEIERAVEALQGAVEKVNGHGNLVESSEHSVKGLRIST